MLHFGFFSSAANHSYFSIMAIACERNRGIMLYIYISRSFCFQQKEARHKALCVVYLSMRTTMTTNVVAGLIEESPIFYSRERENRFNSDNFPTALSPDDLDDTALSLVGKVSSPGTGGVAPIGREKGREGL